MRRSHIAYTSCSDPVFMPSVGTTVKGSSSVCVVITAADRAVSSPRFTSGGLFKGALEVDGALALVDTSTVVFCRSGEGVRSHRSTDGSTARCGASRHMSWSSPRSPLIRKSQSAPVSSACVLSGRSSGVMAAVPN